MKKLLFLLILTAFLSGIASAEDTVLSFGSFDGGGPEFRITVADPEILSYVRQVQYDNPDHGKIDGASYTVFFTFQGLRPGKTGVTVSARSPIAENYDIAYIASVSQDLRVTLTRENALTRLKLYIAGEMMPRSYEVYLLGDDYFLYLNDQPPIRLDPYIGQELVRIIDDYDIRSWDGFDESDDYVLDGEFFGFTAAFSDGTLIRANGNNAFPEGYVEASGEIEELLTGAEGPQVSEDICGTYVYDGEGFGGDFTITLSKDETYTFSEGPLSSYPGGGWWYFERGELVLYEGNGKDMNNWFAAGNGMLVFISTDSDNFPNIRLEEGSRFIKQ